MEKEAKLMASVKHYISEHGVDDFYQPIAPKSKAKLFAVDLPRVKDVDVEEFQEEVAESVAKHKSLYKRFQDVPHIDWLIHRYDVLGYLTNISLSVSPKLKQEWGITHELFGAFYNTDYPYCSLFPDLEPGSLGNVFFFKPKKNMVILVNPPYTSKWIAWTCKKILEWKDKASFYVVLPVWDRKTRHALGLPRYADLPEINTLIEASTSAEIVKLPFYDGITNKKVILKEPVHVIVV
jgi:hypothetical protein